MSSPDNDRRPQCLACHARVHSQGARQVCHECGLDVERGEEGVLKTRIEHSGVEFPDTGLELIREVEDTSFWFAHRNAVLGAALGRYPPGGVLWDIGGGNGYQALHFQSVGIPVVMVEPARRGCVNARKRGVRHVIQSTLDGLGVRSGTLSAVAFLDVLEHLEDPVATLVNANRLLADGGRIFVSVPACPFLWSDEDIFARHKRRYTRASLRRHLVQGGFQIEWLSYYFQSLLVPLFAIRTLPYLMFRSRYAEEDLTTDRSEHVAGGASRAILGALLRRELRALTRGRSLRFGSSLLAVARRFQGGPSL